MIFSVQRFVEDYISNRGFNDPDQYSIALATTYSHSRPAKSEASFLTVMKKIRTAFFRANPGISRTEFERAILTRLDSRFKKKEYFSVRNQPPQELRRQALASTSVVA
jgi:hypothetical protein